MIILVVFYLCLVSHVLQLRRIRVNSLSLMPTLTIIPRIVQVSLKRKIRLLLPRQSFALRRHDNLVDCRENCFLSTRTHRFYVMFLQFLRKLIGDLGRVIPVLQTGLFRYLFSIALLHPLYMGQILLDFPFESVGDVGLFDCLGTCFTLYGVDGQIFSLSIVQSLQPILQRPSFVKIASMGVIALPRIYISEVEGKYFGKAVIVRPVFGGDLVGLDASELRQVYFFIKAYRLFQFHLLLSDQSTAFHLELSLNSRIYGFCIKWMVLMVQSNMHLNIVIEFMGNCFASTQKQKIPKKLQTLSPIKEPPQREDIKLQQYLKIDNQDLRIDVYDINTTSHPAFQQIAKDIDRTYPKQEFFKNTNNKIAFQRLLKRIALHYPKLGYTQGINFVAGYFLLHGMTEVQAYKSFVSILVDPQLMFFGLYEDLFPLARLYCSLFWKLLGQKCKSFALKIEGICVPDEMWIFQWFICSFIYNFPIQYIARLFQFILQEKGFAMVRLAVAVMMHLEKKLGRVVDQFEEQFVQSMESLKDFSFCNEHLPLTTILTIASGIRPEQVSCLLSKRSQNWFQTYFTLDNQSKHQVYTKFINQKDKERVQFFGKVKSGISIVTYQRPPSSVQVMDNIQEKKVKRYLNLYHSLKDRTQGSFVKFAKRYSLTHETRYQLVESVMYR